MNRLLVIWGTIVALVVVTIITTGLFGKPLSALPLTVPTASVSFTPAPGPVTTSAEQQSSPASQPNITWSSPTSVEVVFSPGETASRTITFTSSLALRNVHIKLKKDKDEGKSSSSVKPFLSIEPDRFANVPAGRAQSLRLSFVIPARTAFGTYEGIIALRSNVDERDKDDGDDNDGKTLSELKVVMNVWSRLTDATLGISVLYPPELFVLRPAEAPGEVLIQSSPGPINLGGVLDENSNEVTSGFVIGIVLATYSKAFTIDQWLRDTFPNSTIDTVTPVVVSGISSYEIVFKDEIGAGEPTVVVPLTSQVLQVSYSSTFKLTSPEAQNGLAIYKNVLQSLRLQ